MTKILKWTLAMLILSVILSFAFYHKLTLETFINMTFYIAGGLLTFSLFFIIVQKGFFNGIYYSFRKVLPERGNQDLDNDEIPRISDLITLNLIVPFLTGIILLIAMFIALFIYYL